MPRWYLIGRLIVWLSLGMGVLHSADKWIERAYPPPACPCPCLEIKP